MAQHSLSHTGIKITADAGYDVVSYTDPEGRLCIRRHSPRSSSDVFEWAKGVGYCMTRAAEQAGYRFMGAYVSHPALRPQQTARTIWDDEGIDDYRRDQWFRELEARATLPRSQWAKVSLNGQFETFAGGKRSRMAQGGGKTFWPNDSLPQYVQDRRAGKAPEQQGWVPTSHKEAKQQIDARKQQALEEAEAKAKAKAEAKAARDAEKAAKAEAKAARDAEKAAKAAAQANEGNA